MSYVTKSETYSISNVTTSGEKSFDLSFLPRKGPNGGRPVISKIWVKTSYQVDTAGGVTVNTAQLHNFLKRLRIDDVDGLLVDLTGAELRCLNFLEMGRDMPSDPTDIAASQTDSTGIVYSFVDFAPKERAYRRWDYAVPCDRIKKIAITNPAPSDLAFTGGNPTVDSISYVLHVEWREESTESIEQHYRLVRQSFVSDGTTEHKVPVFGRLLRSLVLWKAADHDTGGADIVSTTELNLESFGINLVDPAVLRQALLAEGKHDRASTQDPFVTTRALPVVWQRGAADGKMTDMLVHDGQPLLRTSGNSVGSLVMLCEYVELRGLGDTKGIEAAAIRAGRQVHQAASFKAAPAGARR